MSATDGRRNWNFHSVPSPLGGVGVQLHLDHFEGVVLQIHSLPLPSGWLGRLGLKSPDISKAGSLSILPILPTSKSLATMFQNEVGQKHLWTLIVTGSEWILKILVRLLQEFNGNGAFHKLGNIELFRHWQWLEGVSLQSLFCKPLHMGIIGREIYETQHWTLGSLQLGFAEDSLDQSTGKLLASQILSTLLDIRKAPPQEPGWFFKMSLSHFSTLRNHPY